MDSETINDIVTALSKVVERLNSTENRLRSVEEAATTALKRLTQLENELKKTNQTWNTRIREIDEKVETLGTKYMELARATQKLTSITHSTAQKKDVEKLRTLVEVLK